MKKAHCKHLCLFTLIAVICIISVSCGDGSQKGQSEVSEPTPTESESATTKSTVIEPAATESTVTESSVPENVSVEYDALQEVFLALNNETTIEGLNDLIADNGLEFTSQDYNGTPPKTMVKLAYSHDVALQRYAEEGDNIEVAFDKQTGAFLYAEYFNLDAFKAAIYYNYGTFWDFSEKEADNAYTGYYYHKSGESRGGIVIEYSNGNKTETGYHKCSDGKEAIKNAIGE